MFRKKITISSLEDTRACLSSFKKELITAPLNSETSIFLEEQVATTLLQFGKQLSIDTVHKINTERIFEGDGYKVTLKLVSPRESGVLKFLKRISGIF
jgi:hypothetical protein